MSVCKRVLVLVLVLDCTQCLPQGAGAPPAMLRGRMTGFQKKLGAGPPERWIQFEQSPTTAAHHPRAGCIRLVLYVLLFRFINIPQHYKRKTARDGSESDLILRVVEEVPNDKRSCGCI